MVRMSVPVVAAFLTGCAAAASAPPPMTPWQGAAQTDSMKSMPLSPDTCDRGVHVRFLKKGGAFRVPPCAGWKGIINYPGIRVTSSWLVTSSVTNNFGAPPPPQGTAIFYMETALKRPGDLNFPNGVLTNTVTSSALTSSQTYTLMVYGFFDDNQCRSTPCPPWVLDIGSPQPGSHSITFSSPLNEAVVLSNAPLVWQFIQN
jgi:hypothetical protein